MLLQYVTGDTGVEDSLVTFSGVSKLRFIVQLPIRDPHRMKTVDEATKYNEAMRKN